MDFHAGDWLVRPQLNLCLRGDEAVHISPKAMELLVCLASRRGEVVSKEEIFREVWGGVYVTDDALTRCIGELRRALRDNAREPSIIGTISKRGHRILAPVTFDAASAASPEQSSIQVQGGPALCAPEARSSQRRAWIVAGCGGLAAIAAVGVGVRTGRLQKLFPWQHKPLIERIAVLPLTNLSGDQEQEYFADGMTDELITQLAQVNGWQVISRTSVMRYKGSTLGVREIGRDLGVDAVVEGSILRAGMKVRITVQLIDAATDLHRWSGSFEGDLGDVVSLQGRIARAIVNELAVTLQPAPGPARRLPKVDPEAYDAYLKGWYFFHKRQLSRSAGYFEAATQKEPGFALAHAMLYEAEGIMCFSRDLPLSERALKAMHRARELDENLSEVHTNLGDYLFFWQWDWEGGMAEFRRAVELDRGSVHTALHYAGGLMGLGRGEESLREFRHALSLDPFSEFLNVAALQGMVNARRYDEAIEQFNKMAEWNPNLRDAHRHVAAAYERLGREREAIEAALTADRLMGQEAWDLAALRKSAGSGGLRGLANERLRQVKLREDAARVPPTRWAALYAAAGDTDQAIRMLETAYSRRTPQLAWVRAANSYDPLRSDPRFTDLLRRMRFPG